MGSAGHRPSPHDDLTFCTRRGDVALSKSVRRLVSRSRCHTDAILERCRRSARPRLYLIYENVADRINIDAIQLHSRKHIKDRHARSRSPATAA